MKGANLVKLGVLAAFILAAYFTVMFFDQTSNSSNKLKLSVNWEKLDKIVLEKENRNLELVKIENDAWVLPEKHNYKASTAEIRAFLLKLMDISTSQSIAVPPSGIEKLGLDEAGKQAGHGTISLYANEEELGKIYLGSLRSRKGESLENQMALSGQYIKHSKSNDVFILPMAVNLQIDPIGWLDSNILNVKMEEIYKVNVDNVQKSSSFFLLRQDDLFQEPQEPEFKPSFEIPGNSKLNANSIRQLVSGLENLNFIDVLKESENSRELFKEQSKVSFYLATGKVYLLSLGSIEEKKMLKVDLSLDADLQNEIKTKNEAFLATKKDDEVKDTSSRFSQVTEDDVKAEKESFHSWVFEVSEETYDALELSKEELLIQSEAQNENTQQ